jgi:enoyl-CoA hydratase
MPIHYDLADGIALVTFDRPESRNAMDLEHYRQLGRCWETAKNDPAVRVVVVTGVGDSFCAGADLKTFIPQLTDRDDSPDGRAATDLGPGSVTLRDYDFYKPIVAAVNGFCVASGMEMLLGMDIRIASERASFGLPEVCRGLFASGGSTVRLPRQLPWPLAMEILLTGQRITAEQALAWGLVNRVVPHDSLLDEAMRFATIIAANSPYAVRETKRSALRGLGLNIKDAYELESEIGVAVFSGPDAKEGPTAFAEKRSPAWSDS